MTERLVRYRWALEPGVGALFLAAWLIAGSLADVRAAAAVVFFCGALALSRVSPGLALALSWSAVLINIVEPRTLGTTFGWIAYLAMLLTVLGAAAHGTRPILWATLASAILQGLAAALVLRDQNAIAVPHAGPTLGDYPVSQALALLLFGTALATGLVLGWLVGYLVARQRVTARVGGFAPNQLLVDVGIAAVFALVSVFAGVGSARVGLVVVIGFAVAVAVRRMSPGLALAVAWLAALVQVTTGQQVHASDFGVLLVLYAAAAHGDRIVRWAGLASAGLGALVASLYLTITASLNNAYYDLVSNRIAGLALHFAFLFVVSVTVLGLSWALGFLVRLWRTALASRRAQVEAEVGRQRAQHDVVVEQERTRIARDMHDVVAHSLAVVIAQADGARYARDTDPGAVDAALTTIAATAREALGDVRLLLGELRHAQAEGPQPTLDDLERLYEQVRAAGLRVDSATRGDVISVGPAHQLAAYRIVQEALTNALRHGDTSRPAQVRIDTEEDGMTITVTSALRHDPGDDAPRMASAGHVGHGLPGMRERATLFGGSLQARASGDRFAVTAFLPLSPRGVRSA